MRNPPTIGSHRLHKKQDDSEHPLEHGLSPDMPMFASAVRDGTLTRPSLRRQLREGSADAALTIPINDSHLASRVRSFSESNATSHSPSENPMTTPGASTSSTPPSEASERERFREVIVHEISSEDSLASVALKYGIKVGALRKANKLWPSDSIHLRKVLYIPVDWKKAPRNSPIIEEGADAEPARTMNSRLSRTRELHPTQRIRASELSFFPARPSLFDAINSLPSSAFPSTLTDHSSIAHSYRHPSVFGAFGNGIEALSRMSSDSLSSLAQPRTSISFSASEVDPSEELVELDLARLTWRNTGTSPFTTAQTPSLPQVHMPPGYSRSKPPTKDTRGLPAPMPTRTVTNRQPSSVAPMLIPGTTIIPTNYQNI